MANAGAVVARSRRAVAKVAVLGAVSTIPTAEPVGLRWPGDRQGWERGRRSGSAANPAAGRVATRRWRLATGQSGDGHPDASVFRSNPPPGAHPQTAAIP